jgi:hypothetical protein
MLSSKSRRSVTALLRRLKRGLGAASTCELGAQSVTSRSVAVERGSSRAWRRALVFEPGAAAGIGDTRVPGSAHRRDASGKGVAARPAFPGLPPAAPVWRRAPGGARSSSVNDHASSITPSGWARPGLLDRRRDDGPRIMGGSTPFPASALSAASSAGRRRDFDASTNRSRVGQRSARRRCAFAARPAANSQADATRFELHHGGAGQKCLKIQRNRKQRREGVHGPEFRLPRARGQSPVRAPRAGRRLRA